MKKILFSALAIFAIAGCAKEIDNTAPDSVKRGISIIAEANPSTKSSVEVVGEPGEKYEKHSWTVGDKLAVVIVPKDEEDALWEFTFDETTNKVFKNNEIPSESELCFAVSPYSFLSSESENDIFEISIPASIDNYTYGQTNALFFSTEPTVDGENYSFRFNHAAGLLKYTVTNIPAGAKSFTLTSNQNISGEWMFEEGNNVLLDVNEIQGASGSPSISLNLAAATSEGNGNAVDIFFPVPVGNYTQFIFTITTGDNGTGTILYQKSTKAEFSITVNRGDLINTPALTLPIEYKKVTSLAEITTGTYLIVYDGATPAVAFNGGLDVVDANGNQIEVTVTSNKIAQSEAVDDASLNYNSVTNTLISSRGKYIGTTATGNSLSASDEVLTNTLSYDTDHAVITSSSGLKFQYTNSNPSNPRFRYFTSSQQPIQLYKRNIPLPSTCSAGLSYAVDSYIIQMGESFTTPTLTNPNSVAVVYSSSNTTVADVNASTGDVTIKGCGSTTITASFEGNGDYRPGSASYEIKVIPAPTQKTVSEFLSLEPDEDIVYILNGRIDGEVDSYGTFTLKDEAENTVEVYRALKAVDAEACTFDDLKLSSGAYVTMYGHRGTTGTPARQTMTGAYPTYYFYVSQTKLDLGWEAGSANFTVINSGEFSYTCENSKFTVTAEGSVVTVTSTENSSTTDSKEDNVIITSTSNPSHQFVVNVVQDKKSNSKTDVLNFAFTGLGTSGSYTTWENKQCSNSNHSSAVYTGNSYPNSNNYIQLRDTSPSGIISTTSGGTVKSIKLSWNSTTANDRTVSVYGSNSPYTGLTDLYDDGKRGTLIATIEKDNSNEIDLATSETFSYIGILASKALYLEEIQIKWIEGESANLAFSESSYSAYSATYPAEWDVNPVPSKDTDADVTYSSSKETVATVNPTTGVVTLVGMGETTISAKTAATSVYLPGSAHYILTVEGTPEITPVGSSALNFNANHNGSGDAKTVTLKTVSYPAVTSTSIEYFSDENCETQMVSPWVETAFSEGVLTVTPTTNSSDERTLYIKVTATNTHGSASTVITVTQGDSAGVVEPKTYSFTPNATTTGQSGNSYVTTEAEFTYNGITWKMNQWNGSSLQVRTNVGTKTNEFYFYNTTAFSGNITKVVLTFSALTLSSTSASGWYLTPGTSEVGTTSLMTTGSVQGVWNSTEKTLTFEVTGDATYFTIWQNGKVASGTNKLATSDAIVVTYE